MMVAQQLQERTVQITQWDGENANKRQVLSVQIDLVTAQKKRAEKRLLKIQQKLTALHKEYSAVCKFDGFTTVEVCDAAQ